MSFSIIFFVIIVFGFIFNLIALFSPYWSVSDTSNLVRQNIYIYQGIWIRCISYSTGNYDCDDFDGNIMGLPRVIQLGRIVRIFVYPSILLGFGGIVTFAVALDCTPFTKQNKAILQITGGFLTAASGLGIFIIAGYYADDIMKQYWSNLALEEIFRPISLVFGWSLIIGWIGGTIQITVGLMAAIKMFCRKNDKRNYSTYEPNNEGMRNLAYRPENPAPTYGEHYV